MTMTVFSDKSCTKRTTATATAAEIGIDRPELQQHHTTTTTHNNNKMMQLPESSSHAPDLYRLVEEEDWKIALARVENEPSEARYVDANTKLNTLQLAVLGRKTPDPSGRISVIRALLAASPESGVCVK